ncbi:hypothetical protein MMC07_000167 [Pseudocyphellaria aurata]|nr:hypothetical protein [Pseudocyphellaria aurata]
MSRRAPNPAAERAAQNQQTIKTLLKLEGNKTCADCKRNKHPRWASWNLGIFVCIRCSGIHRGMGTHISRVKSVDLDAWTDEQLQSVLRWGNSRANKYWEAKLAPGHVPSEAKIENFIRTKYESKRWTMEGPIPDPATLDDEGDDDVPLNVIQEKAKLERSSSQQKSSSSAQVNPDIFGQIPSPPARPSTTDASSARPSPSKVSEPPKQAKPADSLLGLDFFSAPQAAPAGNPSSVFSNPSNPTASSRPDLRQSILSLYASAPRPQPQPQHERQSAFGGMQSPSTQAPPAQQSSFGGLDDAFSGLTFTSQTSSLPPKPQQQSKPNPFAAFDKPANQRSAVASPQLTSQHIGGGGFFDTDPKPAGKPSVTPRPPPQNPLVQKSNPVPLDIGSLDFNPPKTAASTKPPTSHLNDLFDFSDPAPTKEPKPTSKFSQASSDVNSAFNLSAPTIPSKAPSKAAPPAPAAFSNLSTADPWASNDAWATPEPSVSTSSKPKASKPPSIPPNTNDFAWGGNSSSTSDFGGRGGVQAAPKIAQDEDFGGWNSAAPPAPVSAPVATAKQNSQTGVRPPGSGYGGSEDLFSNVWE